MRAFVHTGTPGRTLTGTSSKLLRRRVREEQILDWSEASATASLLPAQLFNAAVAALRATEEPL